MDIRYDDIYRVCMAIHMLTKLDVEFLPLNDAGDAFPPLILSIQQVPDALKAYRNRSTNFMMERIKSDNDNAIGFYHYTDNLMLCYLAVPVKKEDCQPGAIIIGPFLNDIPADNLISNIIYGHNLPVQLKDVIRNYYKALSVLNTELCKSIGQIIMNLLSHPFADCNMKNLKTLSADNIMDKDQREEMLVDLNRVADKIELRYRYEKALLKAVEEGDRERALQICKFIQFDPSHRTPNNPLRAYKNLAFSINTMLRLAAERGGVPPLYLHNLSDKFATIIEKVSSYPEIESIVVRMICEYCELVQKRAMVGYSRIVKKTIEYINLNFREPISLKSLAQNAGVNPSHLSRQFKKELGMGITEFINRRRIREAQFLMTQDIGSITDIAIAVGFESYNYFYRVFKRMTSMTPKDFINQHGKS